MKAREQEVINEIDILMHKFIDNMVTIFKLQYSVSFDESFIKKSLTSKKSHYDWEKHHRSILSKNKLRESLFLRIFVEFERFLSEIIEKSTGINEIKGRFTEIFYRVAEQEGWDSNNPKKEWKDLLNRPINVLLKKKDLLISKETPLKLAFDIFGLGSIIKNKKIIKNYIIYYEGKERRNCLTHSGLEPSPQYDSAIKIFTGRFKDFNPVKIFDENNYKFLIKVKNKQKNTYIRQSQKEIKDLSVSPLYFELIFSSIILLATYLIAKIKRERSVDLYFFHDLISLSEEYSAPNLEKIYQNAKEIIEIESFENFIDIFNDTLLTSINLNKDSEYFKKVSKQIDINLKITNDPERLSKFSARKEKIKEEISKNKRKKRMHLNNLEQMSNFQEKKISDEINNSFYDEIDLKNLLIAHFKGDTKEMVHTTNSMIKKIKKRKKIKGDLSPTSLSNWAVFNKFKNKVHFKKYISKDFWELF